MTWGRCGVTTSNHSKKVGESQGGIICEVGRRITASAPHVAFLDNAFLEKVSPIEGGGQMQAPILDA